MTENRQMAILVDRDSGQEVARFDGLHLPMTFVGEIEVNEVDEGVRVYSPSGKIVLEVGEVVEMDDEGLRGASYWIVRQIVGVRRQY
jgi:hypothetical protein